MRNADELITELKNILPLLEELRTGQDCQDYAFAIGKGFEAMTYIPEAFEALKVIPEVILHIDNGGD